MSILNDNYTEWKAAFPEPATPAQLKNLAQLYGLDVVFEDHFVILVINEPRTEVVVCFGDSPIERYIARIAEWRRGQR
jgi:hypothetical protein